MKKIISLLLICLFLLTGCKNPESGIVFNTFDYDSIKEYQDEAYVVVNDNKPYFNESEINKTSFETYEKLDELGRCGTAFACLSKDTMPTESRTSISNILPTGWHSIDYEGIVEDSKLYNRCHLIAFSLASENDNELNLITGTRYFNTQGMLVFESEVYQYISSSDNHVLYRVTPIFIDDELVCRGVLMEAYSIEDEGEGIEFCVFVYNVQPGIIVDYKTGDSKIDYSVYNEDQTLVLNKNSKKIHQLNCLSVNTIASKNIEYSHLSIDTLLKYGYSLCNECN